MKAPLLGRSSAHVSVHITGGRGDRTSDDFQCVERFDVLALAEHKRDGFSGGGQPFDGEGDAGLNDHVF
jgi:hypothetical protein